MIETLTRKTFGCGRIPKTIYIFDINGTLDCCELNRLDAEEFCLIKEGAILIPTRNTFDYLRNSDTWVGTWSGMYEWMQLQILNGSGIETDFVIMKNAGFNFKSSIFHIYNVEPKFIVVGNTEEDASFAHLYHFDYLHRDEFMNKHKDIIK